MKPNRRDFLKILLSTPIAATLDVEKLLWVPDKTIIVLPPNAVFNFDQIMWETYIKCTRRIGELFNNDDLFYNQIQAAPVEVKADEREFCVPLIVKPSSKEYDDWDF